MAVSISVTSYSLTEGNPEVAALMPSQTYLRDMSVINWTFVVRWSGATKVTSITAEIGVRDSQGRQIGWLLGKDEKTTALSGTRTYTGQVFVPQLSSGYGPGVTSLADGNYTVRFDFIVWNGSSGTGLSTPPTIGFTYATLIAPTVTAFDVYRAYITGARADDGTYLRYSVTANVNKILATDTGTFVLRYRQTGASTWNTITIGSSVAAVSVAAVSIPGTFPISISYECELVITDRYTTVTIAKVIPTGSVLMHFKSDKTGIGIGKYAETPNLFDIALPTRLRSTVTMDSALPVASGGTGATSGGTAMTNLGFGGIKMSGVDSTTKMSSTSTCYIWHFSVDTYNGSVVAPWAAYGQSYYNGCRVLQAGWYLFNGRIVWGDVTASTHGRLLLLALPSTYESLITATLSGTNALPTSVTQYAADYYNAYTDYETASSLSAKATKIMYLPANAVVVVYCNAQTANFSRGGGFFEVCRLG